MPRAKRGSKSYGARPIKRKRRTKRDMERLREAIYGLLEAEHPMSCRGVFYQLASKLQLIEKRETECKAVF